MTAVLSMLVAPDNVNMYTHLLILWLFWTFSSLSVWLTFSYADSPCIELSEVHTSSIAVQTWLNLGSHKQYHTIAQGL